MSLLAAASHLTLLPPIIQLTLQRAADPLEAVFNMTKKGQLKYEQFSQALEFVRLRAEIGSE